MSEMVWLEARLWKEGGTSMWGQDVSDEIVHVQGTMAIDKWEYFSTKALAALPLLFLPCEC